MSSTPPRRQRQPRERDVPSPRFSNRPSWAERGRSQPVSSRDTQWHHHPQAPSDKDAHLHPRCHPREQSSGRGRRAPRPDHGTRWWRLWFRLAHASIRSGTRVSGSSEILDRVLAGQIGLPGSVVESLARQPARAARAADEERYCPTMLIYYDTWQGCSTNRWRSTNLGIGLPTRRGILSPTVMRPRLISPIWLRTVWPSSPAATWTRPGSARSLPTTRGNSRRRRRLSVSHRGSACRNVRPRHDGRLSA